MTPEQWARVTELFDTACEQPPDRRAAWLDTACNDAALCLEVRAMLEAYDTDPEFLEEPTGTVPALEDAVADALVGRRFGAYRLTRQVGRGGMGVVYEAQRDDQEFDRRAAVKILPAWSAGFADRFRAERRVLAALDHPGIARLLDSGTTPDGIAYFVMEFVDGVPVTTWCRRQRLTMRDRVALAERIAGAVAFAHRHLVVHRDLKPANILVTTEGHPKLLDFGIATLLSEEGGQSLGTTRTGHQSFTPEFASPEQVRGERVTTASDVYSLGVLLYMMVADRHPYPLDGLSPFDVMRTVCEVDPPAPSTVAPAELRHPTVGDLDAVVGKALRKAPSERYGSVAELVADLRAWRSGHPVVAAPASFGYRARCFVRRNRTAVAAALAVVMAITAGGVATAWQARVAQRERDKAENRFRQVQDFSRSLLFDVHGALARVPGATDARRLLLDRAVQFLDGLAADAGDDNALKLELAAGYEQLGNVQGNAVSENVGDTEGSAVSYRKAFTLAEEVRLREPEALPPLVRAMKTSGDLASVLLLRDDPQKAEWQARYESLVRELERRDAGGTYALDVAKGYSDIGRLRVDSDDFEPAERAYREALRQYERVPLEGRPILALRDNAYVLKRLGGVLLRTTRLDESEERYRQALAIDERVIQLDDRPQTRYDMTFTMSDLALVAARRDNWTEAAALWARALAIRQGISDADPKDVRALSGVATLQGRLAGVAFRAKDYATTVSRYQTELRYREQIYALAALPGRLADRSWAALRLAQGLCARADAEPRHPDRATWLAEAERLVHSTARSDGKPSVNAGSEPEYLEVHDALAARLAAH